LYLPLAGLAECYIQTRRYEDAIAALDEATALARDVNWLKGVRGWIVSMAGRSEEAQQVLRELEKTAAEQKVDPVAFAYVYMGLARISHRG
jgi:hypothetical protein